MSDATLTPAGPAGPIGTIEGSRIARLLLAAAALACFALGFVGTVLPVMPTTIFWILAAVLSARACPALQRRIYAAPGIGPTVERFVERGAMTRTAKRAAHAGMALAFALATPGLLMADRPGIVMLLAGVLTFAALFVATRREEDGIPL